MRSMTVGLTLATVLAGSATAAQPALVAFKGSEFVGGAAHRFGQSMHGEQVNYVYSAANGPDAVMSASFEVKKAPVGPMFLHLKGRNDDAAGTCKIRVALNDKTLLEGPAPFPADKWATHRIEIPSGLLRTGPNQVVISNIEPAGVVGMPPWFMLAACVVAPREYVIVRDVSKDLAVDLPTVLREFPEPLPEGRKPGFAIRGTKGWGWTPEQYLAEIPTIAKYKMNFLMNCYLSMFVRTPKTENRWWEPLPDELKRAYARVFAESRKAGVDFCFAIHPQLMSPRPMNPVSDEDFEQLWPNFAWAQSEGVRWFALPIDDVHAMPGVPINGSQHAALVNKLFGRLRAADPQCQMVVCPTWYWGDGNEPHQKEYLEALAREMHPDVYVFWTGNAVVGQVTRKAAETFRSYVRHRVILWDNYPVNDDRPTLHLGPVINRDADLGEVLDGYMSNPHCKQNEINRIPLLTCADYAWNPLDYDPARSIGQAIAHLEGEPAARVALAELVEAYPGMLLYGQANTGFNAVHEQFNRILGGPHPRFTAEAFIRQLQGLSGRLAAAVGDRYPAARATLDADIAGAVKAFENRYGSLDRAGARRRPAQEGKP